MELNLNDDNSSYLGDGAYAHMDKHNRLWVVTYNGAIVTNQVCLEDGALSALVRFYDRSRQL